MEYKLFRFLFVFMLAGLALIMFMTGLKPIDYTLLRVCITTLMSLTVIIGLVFWGLIKRKF